MRAFNLVMWFTFGALLNWQEIHFTSLPFWILMAVGAAIQVSALSIGASNE